MYKAKKSTKTSGEEARNRQAGSSLQHGQLQAQQPVSAAQRSYSARPSQLQVALLNHQHAPRNTLTGRSVSTSQPPQLQVAPPGNPYDESTRSVYSDSPSRMQVALQGQRDIVPRRSESGRGDMMQASEYPPRSHLAPAMPSFRGEQPSPYAMPSQQHRAAPPTESRREQRQAPRMPTMREHQQHPMPATFHAERPRGGQTCIVHPGEPHHFGSRTDYERGEIICTLCRCNDPDSHGDAYTMLNSPRGLDINGQPIDWQEAKRRMLNHYGRDQISHGEEIAAAPHVFDAQTAQRVSQTEEDLKQGIRNGFAVSVNTVQNNVDWHNSDRHAKPWLTQEGAKTQFGGAGRNACSYGN